MLKRLIATGAALSLLGACGAPPKLATPDGRVRVPVNSPAAVDEYTAAVTNDLAEVRQQTQVARQLDTVKRDIADLKVYMAAMAARQEDARESRTSTAATEPVAQATTRPEPKPTVADKPNETIKLRAESIMFRITMGPDEAQFDPSAAFAGALLRAARAGNLVEIQAGTDAYQATPANEKIAKARAENARLYLVKNGIASDKVKAKYFSFGRFVADNSTPQGKAKNRRTEIEVIGLNKAELQAYKLSTGVAQ